MLRAIESEQFGKWLTNLRDRQAKARMLKQVQRIQLAEQFVGDWKSVGGGVIEVRLDFGPGYRLYAAIETGCILLLLAGGDKSTQNRDIEKAKRCLADWRCENGIQRV